MLLFNRYEYNPQTDLIGKGGFSRVYKALDKKLNRYLALKVYKTSELSERYSPIAEIQRVIELEHPNISRYIDIEEIEKEDSFGQVEKIQVCVMELLEGGNFENYYNRTKDIVVFKKLLTDVLHGLSYLHRNGIIHRDIKPANILIKQTLDGPVAKITDFGISKRSDSSTNSSSSALIVSIPYMAPEQLNAKKYAIDEKIHYNIDLWSLGVTVFEVLSGEVLFKNSVSDSSEQIMTNIITNELPEKIKSLPSPFNEFVSKCVIKDAKERIKNADELLQILQHSDITKVTTGNLPVSIEELEDTSMIPPKMTKRASDFQSLVEDESLLHHEKDFVKIETADTVQLSSIPAKFEENADSSPGILVDETVIANPQVNYLPGEKRDDESEDGPADDAKSAIVSDSYISDTGITKLQSNEANKDDDTASFILPGTDSKDHQLQDLIPLPDDTSPLKDETKKHPGQEAAVVTDRKEVEPVKAMRERVQETNDTALIATPKSEKEHARITLFNRYDYYPVLDLIGKGGFSRVYKAYDMKLSRWVALKIYKTSEFSDRYSPIAEIKRVINLDHSNICRYLDIEEIEKVNPFGEIEKIQVCVMELLDSGNFLEYFNNCGKDLEVMKKLLQDVLHGISYLHKNGIIHRDIKPANILIKKTVEGPVAKITDFGISKLSDSVNNNSSSALIVSIPYMAPEQLNAKKYGINEKISPNLDLWSLGVTIYEVITGKILFKNNEQDSSEQIMANIMAPELPDKINDLSEPFKSIVTYCIIKNANERAQKAEELLVLLNTPNIAKPLLQASLQPGEPVVKEEPRFKVPSNTELKKPELTIPVSIKSEEQVSKRKIRIALPTPEIEKRAKKQISVLKIGIAAATVLLLIASFFYFKISRNENKIIDNGKEDAGKASDFTTKKPTGDSIIQDVKEVNSDSAKTINYINEENKADLPAKKDNTKKLKNVPAEKQKEVVLISTGTYNPSQKFILKFIVNARCSIAKNGDDMGSISPGKKFYLPLATGQYVITARNEKTGKTISSIVKVSEDKAGKESYMHLNF